MSSIPGWGNKISHASAKKKKILKYKQTNKQKGTVWRTTNKHCMHKINQTFIFFSRPQNIIESLVFARHGARCLGYNAGTYRHGTCPCEKEQILDK